MQPPRWSGMWIAHRIVGGIAWAALTAMALFALVFVFSDTMVPH